MTGHNGAGKSSIFRCMGGLWSIPTGTIIKFITDFIIIKNINDGFILKQ